MKNKNLLLTGIVILGFALTTLPQTVPSYVPTSGLVAWYPFNGNSNDASGNNLNGTVTGAMLTTDRFNNINSAYNFSSSGQHIDFFNSNAWSSGSHTISFWFNTVFISGKDQFILTKRSSCMGGSGEPSYFEVAVLNNSNKLGIGWGGIGGSYFFNVSFIPNQWNNLVYVANGSNAALYINGVLVNSQVYTSNNNSIMLRAGNHSCPVPNDDYIGKFDDLGIWNRALTEQEITNLYIGCSTPPTATITAESSTTFCQGGFVNLKANTGSGYTYQWYNNGNIIINATNNSYIITQSGNYTVKVTDGLCDATSSAVPVTVNANPSNVVTASGATTFCSGNSVTLTAQGTGSYLWSNGATTKQITVNQTGNYFVVVTANGCSSTSSTTNVVVNQAPTATITASGATTFCQGGFVTLTASGGDTYQWNTGASTASINATQSSTYSVIVTSNGCSATASQSVIVNANPSVSLAAPANFININANPVNLYGTPTGGTYSGSGVSGSSFNPKSAGLGKSTISYSYTNASGCIGTATQSTIVYDTTGVVCTTQISVTDTLFIDTNVTGIAPPKNLNTIKVFPNPTKDHITINFGNFASMNGYSLKITNSLGQVVFTTPINQQSSYIDLSKWSGNGVYLVNILDKQNNTIESRKIVLQ